MHSFQFSPYSADRNIPNVYRGVSFEGIGAPAGFQVGSATLTELKAAGFHGGPDPEPDKPGQQPLSEFAVEGLQTMTPDVTRQILRQAKYCVLRDAVGEIVASWDEGRWWTPSESDEFERQLVAELTERS